jgi:hypothetical protein
MADGRRLPLPVEAAAQTPGIAARNNRREQTMFAKLII